jgi:hypothetical protein
VVEGEITLYIGDQPGVRASAGSFAHLPGATVHGFRIESETAHYLILTTPRMESSTAPSPCLRDQGACRRSSRSRAQIEKTCEEYGVVFVGPLPDEN